MKQAGIKSSIGLVLALAFGNVAAEKQLKEINPEEVMRNTDPLILLAFNTVPKHESNWQHFDENGEPKTSKDNAIGLVQVVPKDARSELPKSGYVFDLERLKYEVPYDYAAGLIMYRDGGIKRRIFTQYCSELNREVFALAYGIYHSGGKTVAQAVAKHGADWRTGLGPVGQEYVEKNMRDFDEMLAEYDPNKIHSIHTGVDCHFDGVLKPYNPETQYAVTFN